MFRYSIHRYNITVKVKIYFGSKGGAEMRTLILIFMIVYILSPVDAYPGPIDDIVVLIIGMALRKALKKDTYADDDVYYVRISKQK